MNIEFVTSVAVVTPDPAQSLQLYVDTLGLPLASSGGDYFHSEQVPGTKHFGVWPLSQAAEACFGDEQWPEHLAVPQVSIEFEVAGLDEVADASRELAAAGYELLHPVREEPWGQTVVRLLSPEGAIVGISFAPTLHPAA
ncbi:MAG TPA: VOC family protein [Solirubrobacterales bacterium]|jgi:catechol 2,3-dioxygenase-like lactoylglutathione lyase family enzyme